MLFGVILIALITRKYPHGELYLTGKLRYLVYMSVIQKISIKEKGMK